VTVTVDGSKFSSAKTVDRANGVRFTSGVRVGAGACVRDGLLAITGSGSLREARMAGGRGRGEAEWAS